MKFENKEEELDKEVIDRLETYGIWPKRGGPKITKGKALVLIGEAMFEDFVEKFRSLWKNELFPNCLLNDYAASEKEIYETIHPCKPWETRAQEDKAAGHSILSSNDDCKEVDEKMDEDMKEKVDGYLWLFEEIKKRSGSEAVALTLLQEVAKDRRLEQMQEANNNQPATKKQKKFMDDLGIDYPKTVTKKEASMLIDEELGRNGQ